MRFPRIFSRSVYRVSLAILGATAACATLGAVAACATDGSQEGAGNRTTNIEDAGTTPLLPGDDGAVIENDAALSDAPVDLEDAACATGSAILVGEPVYLHFVVDGSRSMAGNKWAAITGALTSFVDKLANPMDPGVGMGLYIFESTKPKPPTGWDVAVHSAVPLQVQWLKERLGLSFPSGGSPIQASLEGQIPLLKAFSPVSPLLPGGKRVVVLVTDGVPTNKAAEQQAVIDLVRNARAGTPPITTFAIGAGDPTSDPAIHYDERFMGKVAEAGGAGPAGCDPNWNETSPSGVVPCHFQVTPNERTATQLRDDFQTAIDSIRDKVRGCEFLLNENGVADPAKVNVSVGGAVVPKNDHSGWKYDDDQNPTKVILTGETCAKVRSDTSLAVEVVLGCKTVIR